MSDRSPYLGLRRKLVLAFDVGTTYSGISYSVLDPGLVPEIKPVTRFPAHEQISGASKIPTIIYYNQNGEACAVGAEAIQEGIIETAEEEMWVKAEWFKLHLRSKFGNGYIQSEIPPLPTNKTVVQVIADFLRYLLQCASSYIQDTHANGPELWESVKDHIDFVLSHPNGWEGTEQSEMRKAAVLADLIPDTTAGHLRLSFVTEGEASLHFSVQNGLPAGAMKNGDGVVIVDAGGGTIDISSYTRHVQSKNFEEIAAPTCQFHGSVFVSIHAKLFLEKYLEASKFYDDVDYIIRCFDKTTKLRFRSADKPQYIKFGSARDNDANYNVRFGQLKLQGSDVALFFKPSVDCITKAVLEQQKLAHKPISHVVLVGGFAASDWLFHQVNETLSATGLNVLRPDHHVNKAVSDGAISFYLDHFVTTRVSKITYGTNSSVSFDSNIPGHRDRKAKCYMTMGGQKHVPVFSVILPKDTQVSETKEFKKYYQRERSTKSDFTSAPFSIWGYRGNMSQPIWQDLDPHNYSELCTIEVDLSHVPLLTMVSPTTGATYYQLDYHVILQFGLTEIKAQIAWMESGVEKRSPARIVYDPDR